MAQKHALPLVSRIADNGIECESTDGAQGYSQSDPETPRHLHASNVIPTGRAVTCQGDCLQSHGATNAREAARIAALEEIVRQYQDGNIELRERLSHFKTEETETAQRKTKMAALQQEAQTIQNTNAEKERKLRQERELLRQLRAEAAYQQPKLEYAIKSTKSMRIGKKQRGQDAPLAQ